MATTLEELNSVFENVFDEEIELSRETTAQDVEGWDSLMHVTLLINVEKAFRVKFSSAEVASLKNVGEMVDLIDSRRSSH
jgi:acyl carrier protein